MNVKGDMTKLRELFFRLLIAILISMSILQPTTAADLKWTQKPLLVCLPPNQNSDLMKKAFKSWQTAIKDRVTFNFLTANSCPNAQITVSYSADKKSSLTSFSYIGNNFTKAHIEMGLLTKEGNRASSELLYRLMQHEIGHAIGLIGHTTTPKSVMQTTVKAGYTITQDSINEIYRIYK